MDDLLRLLFPAGRMPAFQRRPLPIMKAGGCTLDWTTIPTVTVETSLDSGLIARPGDRYVERGTVLVQLSSGGKFGPADSSASDGRQVWTGRSRVCILNVTWLQSDPASDHPPVVMGGVMRRSALKVDVGGQMSLAQFLTLFPEVTFDDERDG